jgi:hypothetical protein
MPDMDRIKRTPEQSPFHDLMSSQKVLEISKLDGFAKMPQAMRAWFDKLTMTGIEPAEGRGEAQRSIRAFCEAVMFSPVRFRIR